MKQELTQPTTGLSDLAVNANPIPFNFFPSKYINRKREIDEPAGLPFDDATLDEIAKIHGKPVDPTKTPEQLKAEADAAIAAKALADAADLAKQHGGASVDKDGNILDAEGKIVKTAAELTKPADVVAGTKLKIDDVEFTLDKDGNALDASGKVVHTKEQIAAIADADVPLINDIMAIEGVIPKGEDGKPIVYADTIADINRYYKDVLAIRIREAERAFLDSTPGLRDYTKAKQRGLTDHDYFQKYVKEDYSKVVINDKTTKEEKLNIIKKSLERKGFAVAKAERMVKMIETDGTEDAEAKEALTEMQAADKATKEKEEADFKAKQEAEYQEAVEYYKEIQDVITKGDVDGIVIPEAEKKGLYEYIALAKDQYNRSQAQIDADSETPADRVKIAYLRYKKFNLSTIVQSKVTQAQAISLKSRINKGKSNAGGTNTDDKTIAPKGSLENLRIENLLPN